MRSNGNPGSDERIVSIHGLRDFKNMSDHLQESYRDSNRFKKERADDNETRSDAAQMTNAYSP